MDPLGNSFPRRAILFRSGHIPRLLPEADLSILTRDYTTPFLRRPAYSPLRRPAYRPAYSYRSVPFVRHDSPNTSCMLRFLKRAFGALDAFGDTVPCRMGKQSRLTLECVPRILPGIRIVITLTNTNSATHSATHLRALDCLPYRVTSLIRNCPPLRTTVEP